MTFADHVLKFYKSLDLKATLPPGVSYMNPYQNSKTFELCRRFYLKYFYDNKKRTIILGINPGRFGSGITGVSFTDPIKLETICGIPNDFVKKPELSADFIYAVINAYGGPEEFYRNFFISALSPLGFIKDDRNLNYYDMRELQEAVEPFIIESITKQIKFGIDTSKCYCLGEGENFRYLKKLNDRHKFFGEVDPLAHPRFIMQYKRKYVNDYIGQYLSKLDHR